MMQAPANLAEKLATFSDRFSPRTVATYNGNDVMVAKLEGPFHWHKHDDTDDFFLVLSGTLDIELRDRTVTLEPGELFVVPKGVEHRPVAHGEVHILLIEPTGTPNTGDKGDRRAAHPRLKMHAIVRREKLNVRASPRTLSATTPIVRATPQAELPCTFFRFLRVRICSASRARSSYVVASLPRNSLVWSDSEFSDLARNCSARFRQ